MLTSNNIKGQMAQIFFYSDDGRVDFNLTQQARLHYEAVANSRREFLESLVAQGMKGKAYSDAVVTYDKQHMKVF